jgi:hypothetical protein
MRSAYQLPNKEAAPSADSSESESGATAQYSTEPRDALPRSTPGSIHRVALDTSHPLAFGLDSPYFTLKRNSHAYAAPKTGWTVGALATGAPVSGFMGSQAQQQIDDTTIFGTQPLGEGQVVYLVDNPLFRGFWYSGHVLFSNALFFVGND